MNPDDRPNASPPASPACPGGAHTLDDRSPSPQALAVSLRRERAADALCGQARSDRERARAVLQATPVATPETGPIDRAGLAVAAAEHLAAGGTCVGDAYAAALDAFGLTWAQLVAALRRHGRSRWEIETILVACGLNERQRRWAIELR